MTTPAVTNRIIVDGSRCDGRGICALILPERISLDRWGYASIESEPIHDPKSLARAKRAVLACPAQALTLVESIRDVEPTQRRTGLLQTSALHESRVTTMPCPPPANVVDVGDS